MLLPNLKLKEHIWTSIWSAQQDPNAGPKTQQFRFGSNIPPYKGHFVICNKCIELVHDKQNLSAEVSFLRPNCLLVRERE